MRERLDEHQQAIAHKLVTEPLWTQPLVEALAGRFPESDGATVLVAESRCGYIPSRWVQELPESTRVIALDPSREMLDLARQRIDAALHRQIFFVPQRVDALSYADGVFRGAVCLNGLVTPTQLRDGFRELARVIEPSGRILLAAPARGGFPELYDMFDEALRAHQLSDVAARLSDLRASFAGASEVHAMARALGMHEIEVTTTRWEVAFDSGQAALMSPLLRETFLAHWLGIIRSSDRDVVLRYVSDAIDTYFHERAFTCEVQASCLSCTR